jgi:membrane peptidoglycan carboxypeptidase
MGSLEAPSNGAERRTDSVKIDYPRAGRRGVRRWLPSWRQWLIMGCLAFLALVAAAIATYELVQVPSPNQLAFAQQSVVLYSDGSVMGQIGNTNRTNVTLQQIPVDMRYAVLSAEDRSFYDNSGFSVTGIARAAINDVRGGNLQGGSTITQQYAKLVYLNQNRTFTRKIKELVVAVKLDQTMSKDQILEDYLNTVYFGRGAYGVAAASQAYFGVPVGSLTTSQAAVLASVVQAPSYFANTANTTELQARWEYVLDGMVKRGWLTDAQRNAEVFPKFVAVKTASAPRPGQTGYLIDMVQKELTADGISQDTIAAGGLKIYTTIDPKAETAAVAAVAKEGPKSKTTGLRIGIASVSPTTGGITAIYGGASYQASQFNNATQARAQAGSTFKAFALEYALSHGVSLNDRFDGSSPQKFSFPGYPTYRPHNEGNVSYGNITLLKATENSVNTAFVNLEEQITPQAVVDTAKSAGVPASTPGLAPYPSSVLGTSTPHVLDMASAYATLASGGLYIPPHILSTVKNSDGSIVYQVKVNPTRVFDPDSVAMVTYALSKVITDGTGYAAQKLDRPAAGKTGTTDNNVSAWFVGFTPQLSTAVAMFKENSAGGIESLSGTGGYSSVAGGSFPAKMWTAYTAGALTGVPVVGLTLPSQYESQNERMGATPSPGATTSGSGQYVPPTATKSSTPSPTATRSSTPSPTPTPTSTPTPTKSTEPSPPPASSQPSSSAGAASGGPKPGG